jgi:Domain of unknown function (DUF4294)
VTFCGREYKLPQASRKFKRMKLLLSRYKSLLFIPLLLFLLCSKQDVFSQSKYGSNDTIIVPVMIYQGDTLPYKEMPYVFLSARMNARQAAKHRKWTRLRNAVYVTYPYARQGAYVFNDINAKLAYMPEKKSRKAYLKTREQELKKDFAEPLMKLSVYQGKVLMKLIARNTGNTCFEIIKEYKGNVNANFWQGIAWVFGSNLKMEYEPQGEDAEIESIVLDVARMYGDIPYATVSPQ